MNCTSEDYSTIEHDSLHMQDCLSQCKFGFKERQSKLIFFQNIHNEPSADISDIISASKSQLKEVKAIYKQLDPEIKRMSIEIFEYETRTKINSMRLAELEKEEKELSEVYQSKLSLIEKQKIENSLNEELNALEIEINHLFSEIDKVNEQISQISINKKIEEEKTLRDNKIELASKQKRLTIVNIENYTEDIFFWYKQLSYLLKSIFGTLNAHMTEDKCIVSVRKNDFFIETTMKSRKLIEVVFNKVNDSEKTVMLENFKEYALKINDARAILLLASLYG